MATHFINGANLSVGLPAAWRRCTTVQSRPQRMTRLVDDPLAAHLADVLRKFYSGDGGPRPITSLISRQSS